MKDEQESNEEEAKRKRKEKQQAIMAKFQQVKKKHKTNKFINKLINKHKHQQTNINKQT